MRKVVHGIQTVLSNGYYLHKSFGSSRAVFDDLR
jgi:hypothetical protein